MVSAKSLVKGSLILVISNIALKAMSFILLPLYTKYLNPSDYGIIDMVNTGINFLVSFLSLCLGIGFFTYYYDENTIEYQKKVFNSTFWILVLVCIFPAIGLLFSKNISLILFKAADKDLLIKLAMLVIITSIITTIPSSKIRITNKMKIFSFINIVTSAISIVLNIIFVTKLKMAFYSLIVTMLITNIIQIIMYLYIIRNDIDIKYLDLKLSKRIMSYSLPLIPATISSWIIDLSDRYIINHYFSQGDVGIYALANKIVLITIIFSQAFQTAYPSFVFSNKGEDNNNKFPLILNFYFIIFAFMTFSITIFSKGIISLLDKSYWSAYKMVGILLFSQLAYGMAYIVGAGMSIMKKSKYSMMVSWISAIINIILNFILIPKYGVIIAAITTLISYFIVFVLNYYFSQKFYHCQYQIKKILSLFIILMGLSCTMVNSNIIIKILIEVSCSTILFLSFKSEIRIIFFVVYDSYRNKDRNKFFTNYQ